MPNGDILLLGATGKTGRSVISHVEQRTFGSSRMQALTIEASSPIAG